MSESSDMMGVDGRAFITVDGKTGGRQISKMTQINSTTGLRKIDDGWKNEAEKCQTDK